MSKQKRLPVKPNLQQRMAQANALRKLKPSVRQTSAFGDNHHDAIDAQIQVLEENLSEGDIDNRSAFEDEEDYAETDKWKTHTRYAAIDARRWLDGELEDAEDLVASWAPLVVR